MLFTIAVTLVADYELGAMRKPMCICRFGLEAVSEDHFAYIIPLLVQACFSLWQGLACNQLKARSSCPHGVTNNTLDQSNSLLHLRSLLQGDFKQGLPAKLVWQARRRGRTED